MLPPAPKIDCIALSRFEVLGMYSAEVTLYLADAPNTPEFDLCQKEKPSPIYNYAVPQAAVGRHDCILHAKMLLVLIRFFLCWVDYALEGSTFSMNKYPE